MSKKKKKDSSKKKVVKPRTIKKKTGLKAKKKVWVPIFSNSLFDKAQLGISPTIDCNFLKDKCIKTTLSNLTRDLRNQNVTLGFKINKIEDGKAFADPISYSLSSSSVSRIVRKNISKIDNSFICSTKDGLSLRVKPITVTRFKTTSLKTKSINKAIVSSICDKIENLYLNQFIEGLIRKKFQEDIKRTVSKIYPLKIFDIRSFRIARGKEIERVAKTDEAISDGLKKNISSREKLSVESE